jgi:hypothetical protein
MQMLSEENREIWKAGGGGACPGGVQVTTPDQRRWVIFTKFSGGSSPIQALYAVEEGSEAIRTLIPGSRATSPRVLIHADEIIAEAHGARSLFGYAQFESHTVLFYYEGGHFLGVDPEG